MRVGPSSSRQASTLARDAFAGRVGQLLKYALGLLPTDAGIGDALAEHSGATGVHILASFHQEALNHDASDAGAPPAQLIADVGGHIHLPAVVPVAVEPLPAPPGAEPRPPRRVWSIQAGTAVSRRLREGIPNTVMLLEGLSGERHGRLCRCETWQCPPEGGAFRRVASQLLALSPLRG